MLHNKSGSLTTTGNSQEVKGSLKCCLAVQVVPSLPFITTGYTTGYTGDYNFSACYAEHIVSASSVASTAAPVSLLQLPDRGLAQCRLWHHYLLPSSCLEFGSHCLAIEKQQFHQSYVLTLILKAHLYPQCKRQHKEQLGEIWKSSFCDCTEQASNALAQHPCMTISSTTAVWPWIC